MFDIPKVPAYKADLCSAKRLEKQDETASGRPAGQCKLKRLGLDGN